VRRCSRWQGLRGQGDALETQPEALDDHGEREIGERPGRHEVKRVLITLTLRPRSLAPSVTPPLYISTVCQALRQTLRGRRFATFRPPQVLRE
jgi:hypothetical protein